ncbi:PGC-1 and ERR-induced regulator in muscle protein 1 [Labeo rohita]|uniref:PGC-1 and ERR-induced regulator in muscle protein 1 n=2 Tax=Labeo rohita TaxID=84645 RepID=A0ABQ8MLL9_LABRO|nr:PGC-1 and ERR-induced regulator in muscle protein 1 [Labeo rohita]
MDDLDHSVLIAEQDWDCFCTESEECNVQQAKLAALDESGFSDSDDDKTFVPTQTSPDQLCEKDQNQHQIGELKSEHTSENSDFTEYTSPNTEPKNTSSAEQTSDAEANEPRATCEDSNLTEKLNENQDNGENQSSQATNNPVSEMSIEDIKHEKSTDSIEMLTEVTDCSPVVKQEKERWFVTVNDSPVRLRVKDPRSVQKKRRKKKPSKNLRKNNDAMEKCSSLNNTESEIFKQENLYSPNIQNALHIQDIKCILPTGSSENEEEKTSRPISLKKESMTEMPEAKLERNPADSLNSLLTPKQMPQTLFKDLSGLLPQYLDHSTVCNIHNKSIVDIVSERQHTTDNLNHFNSDTEVESPRFILGASKPNAPSNTEEESTEQQEPLGQSYNREESSQSSQEIQPFRSTSGPTPPIFAISSFWDEMEKFTINDILQLRTANNTSLLTESIIPEESSPAVESKDNFLEDSLVDDAADSDYFTHLDDSKPDRSSCEFSTYSDLDDEFQQQLHASANPSPEPLEGKEQTQRFLESGLDLEETWRSESNEMVKLYPESDSSLYLYSETESKMQDIFLTTREDNTNTFLLDRCSTRKSTPSPVLSISDILDNQRLESFFEILSDTEAEQYQTWIPDRSTSLCFSQRLSLAETYDDFFSDFEVGNFLFPSTQALTKSEKTLVPIYSSSHSVVKELEYPEVEEVIHSDCAPVRDMRCASLTETSNMCLITSQRSTWRNLSLRHTKLLMGRTWCTMATCWGFPNTDDTVYGYRTRTSSSSIAQPKLPELFLENQALRQITEHQIHVEATVPDKDHFLFSFKQTDMCLVCIAFASWVLKSSNPQSTDMWKAALLANVSAISAIQYLRRYVKEG